VIIELTETISEIQRIYQLFLDGMEMTVKDVHEKTSISLDNIWVYINKLQKEGRIRIIDKQGRYNLYKLIPREERIEIEKHKKIAEEKQKIKNILKGNGKSHKKVKKLEKDKNKIVELLGFLNNMFITYSDYLADNEEIMDFIITNTDKFNKITKLVG